MADQEQQQPNDAVDERQNEPRRGLEGKGFDAGTGYGGAGNASLYSGESSYGGQAGVGGSRMQGAYSGEGYGRQGEGAEGQGGDQAAAGQDAAGTAGAGNVGRDTDGRGSANAGAARGADEQAVNAAFEGRGGPDRGPDAIDLQDMNGASRREPGR